MVNKAHKGRRYEYEVQQLFEKAGYIVTRASGSHSPFDLVFTKMTENYLTGQAQNKKICFVAFVQCKVRSALGKQNFPKVAE